MAKLISETRNSNPKFIGQKRKFITVKITSSLEDMLVEVAKEYYRVPSKAHAVRLMIEDTFKKYTGECKNGMDTNNR